MCAEQSYQPPVRLSLRTSGLLVVQQQRLVGGEEAGLAQLRRASSMMPQARMKASVSSMRSASSL
jgi:hypothetical protein